MDETTALRLKKIETTHQTAQTAAKVHAQRHVAVLAVALTVGATAAFSGAAGHAPFLPAHGVVLAGAIGVISQLKALRQLSEDLWNADERARQDIDRLMLSGGDQDHDGEDSETSDEGGARGR